LGDQCKILIADDKSITGGLIRGRQLLVSAWVPR
jgi:hypothetical protein